MPNHNYAVLLAGGQGSRFWPQSRTLEPKQFLSLHENDSLFAQTVSRIKPLIPAKNIFIVTSDLYRNQIIEFVSPLNIPQENIICEPSPKNTAPSIGLAVRLISLRFPDARVCVLPCDHMINHANQFRAALNKAFNLCDERLVVFGIPPYRPATGYGYIKVKRLAKPGQIPSCLAKRGESSSWLSQRNGRGLPPKITMIERNLSPREIYEVEKFLEKPDLATAKKFVKNKGYFWNSGIFVGSCRKFLSDFKIHLPSVYKQLTKINVAGDINPVWDNISAISFDYGILEKSHSLLMLKADNLGWSDLGSWQAWDEILPKDNKGNALIGDIINLGSRNVTVLGKDHLIATIGLNDLIVVDTPDALLITKKDKSEEVKKVVDILKANKRPEHYFHRTVKRPWGSYTVLDRGEGFKIKLVEVKTGCSLSLQLHKKRSEHWVVVEGKAKIVKGKKSYYVNSNESTFIPVSCIHRLTNVGNSVLKIVEVQTGTYLEEDDIVRLKDDFGRDKDCL